VLAGRASGEHLAQVLAEDALNDEGLVGRTVARLEKLSFGALSDRQKAAKLKALSVAIATAEKGLLAARKAEALATLEAEYATVSGEAA
jgi:hypothetical protein